MKILLMGGSQFVSRNVLERLRETSYEIAAVTRGRLEMDWAGVRHIQCDRQDRESLKKHLGEYSPDLIIDISAYSPDDIDNLLYAVDYKPCRYILLSSGAVYDDFASGLPLRESYSAAGHKIWAEYGSSKAQAEHHLLKHKDFSVTILRPPYIYGRRNNLPRESFLWTRILAGKTIYVPFDGNNIIQFCDISSLAEFIVDKLAGDPGLTGIFNVGEDSFYTFNSYIDILGKVAGKSPKTKHIYDETIPARDYFPFRAYPLLLDTKKAIDAGFATPSLAEGLADTYQWFRGDGFDFAYEPTEFEQNPRI